MLTRIVVGFISDLALDALNAAGVTIERIHEEPPLLLLALPHDVSHRAFDGNEYEDLEIREGYLRLRSRDLELSYDRRPYDVSSHSLRSIDEPIPVYALFEVLSL